MKSQFSIPPPGEKAAYVARMFDNIAARYDTVNRLMTFGLDMGWRRFAVRQAVAERHGLRRALDVGTGTGDFLPILHAAMPEALVLGADFSVPMMRAGAGKLQASGGRGAYVGGDALRLPFPDHSFDMLTTGFALRNMADIPAALREMHRVTRPGGRLVCLEVARPRSPLLRLGHRIYFTRIVPLIGALAVRNMEAYTYLPQSAELFPPPERLRELMEAAGWRDIRFSLLGLGAVAVHVADK